MKQRACPKCSQVKAEAMAQLELITAWQGRVLDLEAALRDIERTAIELPAARGLVIVDKARAALAAGAAETESARALLDIITTRQQSGGGTKHHAPGKNSDQSTEEQKHGT